MREIDSIIIHCSGTDVPSYDFLAIRNDHVNHRGWSDTGYHYGIDHDGDIHILRPVHIPGAHVKGHNLKSIGICVLGLSAFSIIQMKQLFRLVDSLCYLTGLTRADVYGHNDFTDQKTCPNFDLEGMKDRFMVVK